MRGVVDSFPGTYADHTVERLLEVYAAGPARLRTAIEGLSNEQLGAWPVPGKWSILEIVLHVADSELMGAARVRMVLGVGAAGEMPLLPGYNQDGWAWELGYSGADGSRRDGALALFEALRASTLGLFPALDSPAWGWAGIHPESGRVTLRNLLELYADHSERHLEQIVERREVLGTPISLRPLLARRLY